jgi:hypothetical protein
MTKNSAFAMGIAGAAAACLMAGFQRDSRSVDPTKPIAPVTFTIMPGPTVGSTGKSLSFTRTNKVPESPEASVCEDAGSGSKKRADGETPVAPVPQDKRPNSKVNCCSAQSMGIAGGPAH